MTRTNSQASTRIDRQTDKEMEADRQITDHDEERERETDRKADGYRPVSYTHLTLPTIPRV